jgi:putative endonuclease
MSTDLPSAAQSHVRLADRRRELGRRGEQLAAEHLRGHGCIELARNVRTREGEIDLIVLDRRAIVFVEVKTRRVSHRRRAIVEQGDPLEGLGPRQRLRIRRLAAAWLRDRRHLRPGAERIRFDAIGVLVESDGTARRIDHVRDAF